MSSPKVTESQSCCTWQNVAIGFTSLAAIGAIAVGVLSLKGLDFCNLNQIPQWGQIALVGGGGAVLVVIIGGKLYFSCQPKKVKKEEPPTNSGDNLHVPEPVAPPKNSAASATAAATVTSVRKKITDRSTIEVELAKSIPMTEEQAKQKLQVGQAEVIFYKKTGEPNKIYVVYCVENSSDIFISRTIEKVGNNFTCNGLQHENLDKLLLQSFEYFTWYVVTNEGNNGSV